MSAGDATDKVTGAAGSDAAAVIAAPRRSPEELAELVSNLTNQEKAEVTYDLVYFAARAVRENDLSALAAFLGELEDMAEVYSDPEKRRELQRTIWESTERTPEVME